MGPAHGTTCTRCLERDLCRVGFRNEKSNKLLMYLRTGGGVGSEHDSRIVVWAGSVQHDLVAILLVLSPCTSELDSRNIDLVGSIQLELYRGCALSVSMNAL